jgi:hypothetical protein
MLDTRHVGLSNISSALLYWSANLNFICNALGENLTAFAASVIDVLAVSSPRFAQILDACIENSFHLSGNESSAMYSHPP